MNFWYAWLIIIWIFQSIGFARALNLWLQGTPLW